MGSGNNKRQFRAFISDLHGELDVFEFISERQLGLFGAVLEYHFGEDLSEDQRGVAVELIVSYTQGKSSSNLSEIREHFFRFVDRECLFTTVLALLVVYPSDDKPFNYILSKFGWLLTIYRALINDEVRTQVSETRIKLPVLRDILYQNIHSLSDKEYDEILRLMANALAKQVEPELNVVGDIYDRGHDAYAIMEKLIERPALAIQWGNHDVVWMGAAAGNLACIAVAIRICLRYGTLNMLTEDYKINLDSLASLAQEQYGADPCKPFIPKQFASDDEKQRLAQMHKAIAIIQFKLEGQLIQRRPEYGMKDRLLLNAMDLDRKTVNIKGISYPLLDNHWPTLDAQTPYKLSSEEKKVMDMLRLQFLSSAPLTKHMDCLFEKGGMLRHTGNWLLFHACVPVLSDGELMSFHLAGEDGLVKGRDVFSFCEREMRKAYLNRHVFNVRNDSDIAWFLWCGPHSPLFGKERMTTFERYFVEDKTTHREGKNSYYDLRTQPSFVQSLANAFECEPARTRMVNGHVPVKYSKGEPPVLANGQLFSIDGGFSRPYRANTGLAGLVLLEVEGQGKEKVILYKVVDTAHDAPDSDAMNYAITSRGSNRSGLKSYRLVKEFESE